MALVVVLILAACGPAVVAGAPVFAGPADMANTKWLLTSLNNGPLLPGTYVTLHLADGRVTGSAGCNRYDGSYTATEDGTLAISELAITVELCPAPAGLMAQEDAYRRLLAQSVTYQVSPGDGPAVRLDLAGSLGDRTLTYTRQPEYPLDPSDLVGSRWQLRSWAGRSSSAEFWAAEDVPISLGLAATEIRGHAPCRDYRGAYQVEGDRLQLLFLEMLGTPACRPALLALEGEYTTSLEWMAQLNLQADRLDLHTGCGEVLGFAPLVGE